MTPKPFSQRLFGEDSPEAVIPKALNDTLGRTSLEYSALLSSPEALEKIRDGIKAAATLVAESREADLLEEEEAKVAASMRRKEARARARKWYDSDSPNAPEASGESPGETSAEDLRPVSQFRHLGPTLAHTEAADGMGTGTEPQKRCRGPCQKVLPLTRFGKHEKAADGHQSYCKSCREDITKRRRNFDMAFRLRHHFSTRIAGQLNPLPPNYNQQIEHLLGYKLSALVDYLNEDLRTRGEADLPTVLRKGWHIDHIYPLSQFSNTHGGKIDLTKPGGLETFRACWHFTNLRAIPASENLAKGARTSQWD